MAIHDFVAGNPKHDLRPEHFPILATDVSARSLIVAKNGRYYDRDLDRGITSDLRIRYFHQQGDIWTVNDELRRQIDFRRLNFIDPMTNLGPFEVILCRNVLFYFDEATRQRLCNQFYDLLSAGGLLILGAAESLYGINTLFQSEKIGSTFAYRKTGEVRAIE